MTRRIVCVGSIVQDEVYRMERLPSAGIKMDAYAVEDRFGGPAATAAVAIAMLGGRASFWGRLGRDSAGEACIAALAAAGVDGNGVNGITHEALLAIVADRLRSFQAGPYSCKANACALTHIEEAQHWLQQRTLDRMRRGIEGTHTV